MLNNKKIVNVKKYSTRGIKHLYFLNSKFAVHIYTISNNILNRFFRQSKPPGSLLSVI